MTEHKHLIKVAPGDPHSEWYVGEADLIAYLRCDGWEPAISTDGMVYWQEPETPEGEDDAYYTMCDLLDEELPPPCDAQFEFAHTPQHGQGCWTMPTDAWYRSAYNPSEGG